ncbi:MAG TPA: indolepyruvate oxidoreductase subunit beta [Bacillota bacterium]|nr:indolepyruvate oxidoreductase subunit beta [Bacillota bacterium]HPT86614.1 indolepyruvate oxidoreductase subunit beta [Bacillota bacterium]
MNPSSMDIVIAGVGGQGTVLASRVLAQAALEAGLSAKTSETIGMAQREGTVQSHVRIGKDDFGPVIGTGQADVLLAFEPAEAVRALGLLKPGGLLMVNDYPIRPVTVTLGTSAYQTEAILDYLKNTPFQLKVVRAFDTAIAAGSFKAVNTVMLGALAATGRLPFSRSAVLKVLLELVPAKAREINERGFELGAKL